MRNAFLIPTKIDLLSYIIFIKAHVYTYMFHVLLRKTDEYRKDTYKKSPAKPPKKEKNYREPTKDNQLQGLQMPIH